MTNLLATTDATSKSIARILAGMVKANVKRFANKSRIVVIGTAADAQTACDLLASFDFCGATGNALTFGGTDNRYTIWAYRRG